MSEKIIILNQLAHPDRPAHIHHCPSPADRKLKIANVLVIDGVVRHIDDLQAVQEAAIIVAHVPPTEDIDVVYNILEAWVAQS